MKLDSARALKRSLLASPALPQTVLASYSRGAGVPVAFGIAGSSRSYKLAVRVHTPFSGMGGWLERVRSAARGEVDVRVTGPIRAQAAWGRGRVRPLVPGVSIGHERITAGTLGGFVVARGASYVLSNNHVLADEDRAKKGDAVLQPGRYDGGKAGDLVARFERAVRLRKTVNLVDAAIARLEDGVAFDASKLRGLGVLGPLREEPLEPGDRVAKLGRTTGLTRGVVSAIEVDRVLVGYDRGELRFDDQVEVSPAGRVPFSRGGDSGSWIVDARRQPCALLFAGNDADTTYANPLGTVLVALRVELAPATSAELKRHAYAVFSRHGKVTGVGVTKRRGKPALKVNFARAPRRAKAMPKEVGGMPVVVAVTGEIRKQEA
jgi:hypothetical protein